LLIIIQIKYSFIKIEINIIYFINNYMDQTKIMNLYKLGNVEELIKNINIYNNYRIIKNKNNFAFCWCCRNGYLEMAKWLLEVKPDINIAEEDYFCFLEACCNGHIEVVKWLLDIIKNDIFDSLYEYGFSMACCAGHLEMAKFLYNIKQIIIKPIYEDSFYYACENGHLEVAKWLLDIFPTIDISVVNEAAFVNSCENNHLEVAKWLHTFNSEKYDIESVDNKIISYKKKKISN